jgi:hypothetical protein
MQNPFEFDPADANGPVLRPKQATALISYAGVARKRSALAEALLGWDI